MRSSEREIVRDALAEAVAEYAGEPTESRGLVLAGMRYIAALLGMPEGNSNYDWTGERQPDRAARRRILLRRRGGRA